MTKFLLTFILNFTALILMSQTTNIPVDEDTGEIIYRDVVDQKGTKEDFFNSAISWINSFYTNPVDVTQTRDPQSGIIKGLHRIKLKNTLDDGTQVDAGSIQYRFTLEFKEDRYRYTLFEFVLRQSSKIPAEKWLNDADPLSKSYLKQIDDFAKEWIASLKEGMLPKVEKTDEW